MAAGLGFKDFVTGEVLTAADVDGYLMQGVWVFASAAARDAAVTSPQEGNFAYLKDTNVTTYYTGSAWANLDTTGMTNPMTTTGDTIYSSSGSTPARLGIGSTGQVLTVAAGIPSWATPTTPSSGLTLLNKTTLSSTTSVSLNNVFSSSYDNYRIQWTGKFASGATDVKIRMRVSGADTNSGIYYYGINSTNSAGTVNSIGGDAQTNWILLTSPTTTSSFGIDIFRPFATECTTYNGTMMQRNNDRGGYTTGFIDNATSYDGFTIFFANNCVGTLAVYGYGI